MTPNEYQELAARTLDKEPSQPLTPEETMIIWNVVGLGGEAGEVCEYLKKGIFHRHGYDPDVVREELGDCLWYIAGLCTQMGFSLGDVMQGNIDKLVARYPGGFSIQDSIHRREYNTGGFDK